MLLGWLWRYGSTTGSWRVQGLVQQHTGDPRWGAHAQAIMQGSMWKPPGNGGHDDRAHPPIHPTKHSTGEANWCADKRRLYEFVVRSFLATCSKPAVGRETRIDVSRGGEAFHATGLVVVEQNWLAVYPYTRWGGNGNLPHVHRGQRLSPVHLTLQEVTLATTCLDVKLFDAARDPVTFFRACSGGKSNR